MTDRSLVYRISVRGQAEAQTAIKSVLDAAQHLAREEMKVASSAAKASVDARRRGLTDAKRIMDDEARHASALASTNRALEARNAKSSVAAAERAEREKTKATTTEARNRERAIAKEYSDAARELDKAVRLHEKGEKRKTADKEREAKKRSELERKEATATANWLTRAQESGMRHQVARQNADQRRRERMTYQAERDNRFEERRFFKGIGSGIASGVGLAVNYTTGMVSRGAGAIATGSGLRDAVDVAGIVSERGVVNNKLRQIAIEARGVGQSFGGFDMDAARAGIKAAARDTGINQESLIGALYVASEKGKAPELVPQIGRIARESAAMGVGPEVVAKLRAQMLVSADATGQKMSETDLRVAIAKMSFIGKTGVFRSGDIARQSEELLSRAAVGGLDFNLELGRFVGFANMAKTASGGSAKARTSINSIQDAIAKNQGKLHQHGIETEVDGQARNFIDVIEDVIVKGGGNIERIKQMGIGDTRAMKAFLPMLSAYKNTAGGDAEKRAAMEALVTKSSADVSNTGNAELLKNMDQDIDYSLAGEGTQLKKGVEEIRQTIAEQLEPALLKLAKIMPDVVNGFSTLASFVKQHPYLAAATALEVAGGAGLAKGTIAGVGRSAARLVMGRLVSTVPSIGGPGGAVAGAIGTMINSAGATPVFVTNMPMGGMGGGGGMGPGGGVPGAPGGGKFTRALGALGTWGTVLTMAAEAGSFVGDQIHDRMDHGFVGKRLQFGRDDGGGGGVGGANTWRNKVASRKGTAEDRAEFQAGRAANKERKDWIADYLNADMATSVGSSAGMGPLSNEAWSDKVDDRMNRAAGGGPSGMLFKDEDAGSASPKGAGAGAPNLTNFVTAIDGTTKALEDLQRKLRATSVPGQNSVLK